MHNLSIIGMGKLGSALSEKFNLAGLKVKNFDKNSLIAGVSKSVDEAVRGAEVVFLCIPTSSNTEMGREAVKYCPKNSIIVSFSKGVSENGKTASEILSAEIGKNYSWAVVGGPMIAEDIKNGNNVTAVIGSKSEQSAKVIEEIFKKSDIRVISNFDPFVISFLGVLKNVYSVGFGIIVGLDSEKSKKEIFIEKVVAEMKIFCENNKINPEIVYNPAGLDDFLATSGSPNSRNRMMGVEIGKTGKIVARGEAFEASIQFIRRFPFIKEKMPLFFNIAQIIEEKQSGESIMEAL